MITQGQTNSDELRTTLRSLGPVDVRLLVQEVAGERSLVTAVVNAGGEIDGATEEVYDYGEIAFATATVGGDQVADWLARGAGEIGSLSFSVPEPGHGAWNRWPSRTYAHYGTLFSTPHTDYSVPAGQNRTEPRHGGSVLAGAGLPFFRDVNVAVASVLFDVHSMRGGQTIPHDLMLVRVAHPEAYFERIRVSSTAIVASVRGEHVDGVRLQVSSAGQPSETRVREPGDVHAPVDGGSGAEISVALTRGKECLDYRTISSRWPNAIGHGDIVFEPDDLADRIDRMRWAGENEEVEFKEAISKGDRIARAVAAFANGGGGTVIIGIADGTGEVVGIANEVGAARDRLDNIVRNHVRPAPEYDVNACTLEGQTVLALHVTAGDERPYGAGTRGGIRYYVRRGASNWVAEPDEIRALVPQRRPGVPEPFS